MAKSDDSKKAKKLKSPFGNRIQREAAEKAAKGPDLGKTSIPALVEKAPKSPTPKKDPNAVGFEDLGFTPEQHSAETDVLPVDTTRVTEDIPPTEDAPVPANIPPTEPDVRRQEDKPSTEILPSIQEDIPKTEIDVLREPTQSERVRVAGLETEVIALEDTEDTIVFDGTETEQLDGPTVRISTEGMKAIATEKPSFWSKVPIVSSIINYKSRTQKAKKIEDTLRKQAAEAESAEPVPEVEPAPEPSFTEEAQAQLDTIFGEDPKPAPPEIPASVANAETEPLDVPEVGIETEPLTDDEDTTASATGETEVPSEDAAEPAYVPTPTEPEDPEIGMETEPLTDVEEPEKAPSLEDAVEEKAPMYTAGVTFCEKYAYILMHAAGEKAAITEDNKEFWEEALENVDLEAEKNPAKENFRNYLFAVYASADGCKSKDKEVLIYVLSELARVNSDKGEHEKAFKYARRARKLGKVELLKAPTAETLHKWGMLEHNIAIYEKEMKESTVAIEA